MKIDFDQLDQLVAAGASGAVIVQFLRMMDQKREPKRQKEKARLQAKRSNKQQQQATSSNNEQQTPTPSQIAEKELFRRGKEVLGKTCGGMVTNLVKSCRFDLAEARRLVELAATKGDPRQFIVGCMKEKGNGTGFSANGPSIDDLIARAEEREGQDDFGTVVNG